MKVCGVLIVAIVFLGSTSFLETFASRKLERSAEQVNNDAAANAVELNIIG